MKEEIIGKELNSNAAFLDCSQIEKMELALSDTHEVILENGKVFVVRKQPQYPKTYIECAKILNCFSASHIDGYKNELLEKLQELLICLDAYWKIAGEKMRLGKPWEPDWESVNTTKYVISRVNNKIELFKAHEYNYTLAFPTEEMRDAFYENFNGLIEECKELL